MRNRPSLLVFVMVVAMPLLTLDARQPVPQRAAATPAHQARPTQPAAQPPSPASTAPAATQPPGQPAQPPPITFRVQIDYVEVDALVTDAQGNPVRDLRAEDFEVLEDGAPQKVTLFAHIEIPVARPDQPLFAEAPIERDVQMNTQFDGRMYVLLLDDLHTYPARTALVRRAARQFIERNMGANDVAAVVQVSGRTDASQDFTSNKRLLLAAVDKFTGRGLQSSYATRMDEYYRQRDNPARGPEPIKDPEEAQRVYNARAMLDTVKNVATFLEGVRGRRKAVLLFSEGVDFDVYDVFTHPDATTVNESVRDAVGAATRANVALYTIDPRGLTTLGDEAIEVAGVAPDDPTYGISKTELQDALRRAQDSLRGLAEQTGGYAVINTNDFRGAYDRIVTENSSYYVLGYYPTNDRRDGRFRKIEVRVRRPGLQVKSRKGYVAPRGKPEAPKAIETAAGTSTELREALNSPVPETGLAMAVNATPFKGEAPKASVLVTVQVDGRRFKFTENQGQFNDTLELSLMAIDAQGKIQGGDRQTVELKLRPQTRQAVELAGFRALSRLALPPGRYQLRVGARAVNANAVGSVYYDLEVPDFSKAPFGMSGLVLTSTLAGITPTARQDDELKDVLKGPPTTVREFSVAETMAVFTEVYVNKVPTAHAVDITTTLRASDGRVVFKTEESRSTDELQGARGGFGYVAQIPLKEIAPGEYVLRVEARSRLSGVEPIARETMVRLWPVPQREPAPEGAEQQKARMIVRVDGGPRSTVDAFETAVARNDQEWQALWAKLPARRAAPKVTFENTMIVAVFLGTRPSAGYSVEVVGLGRDGDTLVVQYAEKTPAAGVASADVITTPYVIAGVPRYDGPVRFDKVETAPRP